MPSVFVYGTLKRGGANHHSLLGQRFVGLARTSPQFRLYDLGDYPGMTATTSGGQSIEGEIWEVDPACVARLDELEGVGHGLYARKPIALCPPHDGLPVETYLFLGSLEGRRELGTHFP